METEFKLINFVNDNQRQDDTVLIPESIFAESVKNFQEHKRTFMYTNYGLAHGIGLSAMTFATTIGSFGGPLGMAVGTGVGGIIWGICGATGTIIDRCVISSKDVVLTDDYKYYQNYKNIYLGDKKEYIDYFPTKFNSRYIDTIKIKIDSTEISNIFGPDKKHDYKGEISGEFNGFQLMSLDSCKLYPINQYNEDMIIKIEHNVFI